MSTVILGLPSISILRDPNFFLGNHQKPRETAGFWNEQWLKRIWPWVKIQIVPPVNNGHLEVVLTCDHSDPQTPRPRTLPFGWSKCGDPPKWLRCDKKASPKKAELKKGTLGEKKKKNSSRLFFVGMLQYKRRPNCFSEWGCGVCPNPNLVMKGVNDWNVPLVPLLVFLRSLETSPKGTNFAPRRSC